MKEYVYKVFISGVGIHKGKCYAHNSAEAKKQIQAEHSKQSYNGIIAESDIELVCHGKVDSQLL